MTTENTSTNTNEVTAEVKTDTVKRINFSIDGLMDGIDLEAIGKACKDLTGEHDVIMDGEVFKKYVDAIAVLRNAEVLIKRIKEVEKKLHLQIDRGMAKNSKLQGVSWFLQANYTNQVELDKKVLEDLKVSNADAVREIATVASKHDQLSKVTSAVTLKKFDDDVDAEVIEVATKYGLKVVESDPQIKPPTEIKVKK